MRPLLRNTVSAIGCIMLFASGTTYSQTTVRMEAEDMQLDTYRIEMLDFASNGALINLKGPGFVGTATAPFPGISGEYDINVVYHDENDGQAQLSVSIESDIVDSWTLDLKSDESQPQPANRFTRQVATGYTVNTGDEVTIYGLQGNWDHANVDYIDFALSDDADFHPSIRIVVGDGDYQVGDPPYSTYWQAEVDIDPDVLQSSKTAHLEFYCLDTFLGRLVINGNRMHLPDSSAITPVYQEEIGKTIVSVPLAYLKTGENTIRFEAGRANYSPSNLYDDIFFGDIVLIFSMR